MEKFYKILYNLFYSESKSIDSGKPLNWVKEYQDNDTAFNCKSNAIKNLKIRIQNVCL